MGLYNFRSRFVASVLNGTKTHTIRGTRKRPDKPGATMHLYNGLRQKGARLLMRAPCIRVEPIYIDAQCRVFLGQEQLSTTNMTRDAAPYSNEPAGLGHAHFCASLSNDECEALALRDGFSSFADMMSFWEGRLPFHGHVYHWDPRKRSS
jgi:hypothetical protein